MTIPTGLQRILTAIVGAPLLIGSMYLGGWTFGIVILVVALFSQHEVYGLLKVTGQRPMATVGLLMGALVVLEPLVPVSGILALLLAVVTFLYIPRRKTAAAPLAELSATFFGVLYPSLLLTFILKVRLEYAEQSSELEAFYFTVLFFFMAWAADTFAYYTGRLLGRHLLAPTISPKKTWEGAAGGLIGASVMAVLSTLLLPTVSWLDVVFLSLIIGAIGPLGDLTESRMKRSSGVKDSGHVLPGHGGVLDRFDTIIVLSPLYYLYIMYVFPVLG